MGRSCKVDLTNAVANKLDVNLALGVKRHGTGFFSFLFFSFSFFRHPC
jgi:hypothetical protein